MPGDITLDGAGNSTATFIFRIAGQFNVASSIAVTLVNCAFSKNVYWVIDGAVTIGSSTVFVGTIIAGGAIELGSGTTIQGGRALST